MGRRYLLGVFAACMIFGARATNNKSSASCKPLQPVLKKRNLRRSSSLISEGVFGTNETVPAGTNVTLTLHADADVLASTLQFPVTSLGLATQIKWCHARMNESVMVVDYDCIRDFYNDQVFDNVYYVKLAPDTTYSSAGPPAVFTGTPTADVQGFYFKFLYYGEGMALLRDVTFCVVDTCNDPMDVLVGM